MNKPRLSIFLIALIVSSLVLVITVHLGTVNASTNVSDIITSDTIWTGANSPYSLTGNIFVNNDVTLTIEPGVIVNFNGYFMNVGGTLSAKGSEAEKIIMRGSGITYSGEWKGRIVFLSTSTNSTIENAEITSTPNTILGIYSSPKISHTIVGGTTGTAISIIDGSPIIIENIISNNGADGITVNAASYVCSAKISNNVITNNTAAGISIYHGAVLIQKNNITNNYAGVYNEEWWGTNDAANITENIISNNYFGIQCNFFAYGSPYVVSINVIINNYDAIMIQPKFPSMGAGGSGDIFNNTIAKNTNAIMINGPLDLRLNQNNIFEKTNYLVRLDSTSDINATQNWWGTTNTTTISQSIYDFYDDFNLGKVNFLPILVAPNALAPAIPTFTISSSAGTGGSISPTGSLSVNYGGSQTFNIAPNTGYHVIDVLVNGTSVGAVSSYTIQNIQGATAISATFAPNPTPTPSPTPSPTPTPSPSPSPSPSPTATPTPTLSPTSPPVPTATPIPTSSPNPTPTLTPTVLPTPSPAPSATTVPATTDSGSTVDLVINGNVTSSQMSSITIASSQSASTTTVSFTLTGQSGTTGFGNVTIPKSAVPYGTTPTIYIDNQACLDQGYTQDANNYYVWYTTHFSTHDVSIVFTGSSATSEFPLWVVLPLIIIVIVCVAVVLMVRKRKIAKST